MYIKQRDVDVLPLTCDVPMIDGGENGGGGVERGHQVNHRDADFLRCAVCLARDAHQPAHRLNQRVVPRAVFVWAALSKACDGAVNDVRVDLLNAGVVQVVFFQATDFVVFNQYIGGFNQFYQLCAVGFEGEIEQHIGFISIGTKVVGRVRCTVSTLDKRWPPTAGIVTFWVFDFNHVCAHIGEVLRSEWPRENARHINNGEVGQCRHFLISFKVCGMAKRYNRTSAVIASDDIDDLSERSNLYSSIECDTHGLLRSETARNDGIDKKTAEYNYEQ